jgi:ring-1,2-phenylacetyl-CoA epoxidase subunit PaaE
VLQQPVIIQNIYEEAEGFKTFVFASGHHIRYRSGQYLTFLHQTKHGEIRRSYSITSSPLLNEPLSIGIKRVENGTLSRELVDHTKPGDELLTTGAGGFFTLPDDMTAYKKIVFLAAGSGITPVYSLIKTSLYGFPHLNIVLIYSSPSPERTIFYSRLQQLQHAFPNRFQLRFLFSNSPRLDTARLNRELLTQLVRDHLAADPESSLYYICGPESYMRMCTYTLQEAHIPGEHIRKENFIIQPKHPVKAEPPDKEQHWVSIHYENELFRFSVQYPDTILKAAKKNGIALPYSCEAGSCGNCAATCIRGKVWLSYNEVLTEKDLEKGLTLTCVGHPVNGDVELKIGSS